jgi:hypothetical protein
VMITASGDQDKAGAIEAGADDFITKPTCHFPQRVISGRAPGSVIWSSVLHCKVRALRAAGRCGATSERDASLEAGGVKATQSQEDRPLGQPALGRSRNRAARGGAPLPAASLAWTVTRWRPGRSERRLEMLPAKRIRLRRRPDATATYLTSGTCWPSRSKGLQLGIPQVVRSAPTPGCADESPSIRARQR